jgi:hypothetical protein
MKSRKRDIAITCPLVMRASAGRETVSRLLLYYCKRATGWFTETVDVVPSLSRV